MSEDQKDVIQETDEVPVSVVKHKIGDFEYVIDVFLDEESKTFEAICSNAMETFGVVVTGRAKWDGNANFSNHFGISLATTRCIKQLLQCYLDKRVREVKREVVEMNNILTKIEGYDKVFKLNRKSRKDPHYRGKRFHLLRLS